MTSPQDAHEALVEKVALYLARIEYDNNNVEFPSVHHYDQARGFLAIIAEETKTATEEMLSAWADSGTARYMWEQLHLRSALYPKPPETK